MLARRFCGLSDGTEGAVWSEILLQEYQIYISIYRLGYLHFVRMGVSFRAKARMSPGGWLAIITQSVMSFSSLLIEFYRRLVYKVNSLALCKCCWAACRFLFFPRANGRQLGRWGYPWDHHLGLTVGPGCFSFLFFRIHAVLAPSVICFVGVMLHAWDREPRVCCMCVAQPASFQAAVRSCVIASLSSPLEKLPPLQHRNYHRLSYRHASNGHPRGLLYISPSHFPPFPPPPFFPPSKTPSLIQFKYILVFHFPSTLSFPSLRSIDS